MWFLLNVIGHYVGETLIVLCKEEHLNACWRWLTEESLKQIETFLLKITSKYRQFSFSYYWCKKKNLSMLWFAPSQYLNLEDVVLMSRSLELHINLQTSFICDKKCLWNFREIYENTLINGFLFHARFCKSFTLHSIQT